MTASTPTRKLYKRIQQHETNFCTALLKNKNRNASFSRLNHYLGEIDEIAKLTADHFAGLLFRHAMVDLQKSMNNAAHGRAQEAHTSLRMALEKQASFIWFSAAEFEFALWKMHRKDISWKALSDPETGIFSKNFSDCFSPDLSDLRIQFHSIMVQIYRECSEYIHGNFHFLIDNEDEFDFSWYNDWSERMQNTQMLILFLWVMRFYETHKLSLKDHDVISELLGTIPAIRAKIGSA